MALPKLLLILSMFIMGDCFGQSPMFKLIAKRQSAVSCTYPLDTYTGAAGAYTVAFKVKSTYDTAYRVRRDNDNAEQDILYSGCQVDTAALKSFCGSNSCYVVKLYDNTGGGNHVTQSTASAQARVVNAGVVERVSGEPSMYFDGGDGYNFAAFAGQTRMDFYFVASTSDASYVQFYGDNGSEFVYVADGYCLGSNSNAGTPELYTNGNSQTSTTRCDVETALNGTYIVTIQNSSTSTWGTVCTYGNYSGFEFTGYVSQLIGWNSDQSANRSGIVTAFNTQFTIY